MATGRSPLTKDMGLENTSIEVDSNTGRIVTNEKDATAVDNIYAIGDVAFGRPELTPAAIQAGHFLAHRLYRQKKKVMDYGNVATTVFTPMEYGWLVASY